MSVTELVSGESTFHVIGTAHVSAQSVEEVREVIARVQPDVVCVELDRQRHETLTRDTAFREIDVSRAVREGRALAVLAHLALAAYQRQIGMKLGIKPGAELLAAIDAARAAQIPVELIDRDIDITLKRTWRNIGPWRRVTLFASLFVPAGPSDSPHAGDPFSAQAIEDLKQPRALSDMLTELGRAVPEIKGPLIDERDQYLASRLGEAARGRRTVVAVVGAAHVPGIRAQLGAPIDRAALERIPPPSLAWRAIKWLVPLALAAALLHAWRSDAQTLAAMLRAWILPTAIGAGAATLAAGGSLWSALSALAVAPIAAVHPSLGTGMVVGRVEARRRRPGAADRERLVDDLQNLRGMRRNPVSRILLVAIAAGLGTTVGSWVAAIWMLRIL